MVTVDGVSLPLESPLSADELAARVRASADAGTAIYPVGGGTALDYGTPPSKPGVALSLGRLNNVVDYPVRDLTITVEAGMTVGRLQQILATEGQWLPVDVSDGDRATLGGALAVNASGPRRLRWGTFRDHVIGITVVNDRGELCTAGGRVVKNVAGYDLAKLYVGSLGALGIITQVTLKLQPRPASAQWVETTVAGADLGQVMDALHTSRTQPAAVELLNGAAASPDSGTGEWTILVLFEDARDSVAWQVERLRSELSPLPVAASSELKLISSPAVTDCAFSVQVGVPPSALANAAVALHRPEARLHAHALSGVIRGGFTNIGRSEAAEYLRAARAAGHTVIRRCPSEWKSELQVWDPSTAADALARRVKRQFDPVGMFNPGRTAFE